MHYSFISTLTVFGHYKGNPILPLKIEKIAVKLKEIAENCLNDSRTATYPQSGSLCPENGNYYPKMSIFVPTIKNWRNRTQITFFRGFLVFGYKCSLPYQISHEIL